VLARRHPRRVFSFWGVGRIRGFRQALTKTTGNLNATFNLAQILLTLNPVEHRDKADWLLPQVIEAQAYGVAYSEPANKAKNLRSSIARRDLRADQPDGLRQDAVSYCLQALQLLEWMDQRPSHGR